MYVIANEAERSVAISRSLQGGIASQKDARNDVTFLRFSSCHFVFFVVKKLKHIHFIIAIPAALEKQGNGDKQKGYAEH